MSIFDNPWTYAVLAVPFVFTALWLGMVIEERRWHGSVNVWPVRSHKKNYVVMAHDDYLFVMRRALNNTMQWQNPETAPKDGLFIGLIDINGPYWETCVWSEEAGAYVDSFSGEHRRLYGWQRPSTPDKLPLFPV